MKSEVKGTARYEERGQGYRDIEKVGKHCYKYRSWIIGTEHAVSDV
jgi:hypothetical protein